MSFTKRIGNLEVVHRAYDNMYVVYEYRPWPDDVLDNNPKLLRDWLMRTKGWRAHGWIPVYVTKSGRKANRWAWKRFNGDTLGEEVDDHENENNLPT